MAYAMVTEGYKMDKELTDKMKEYVNKQVNNMDEDAIALERYNDSISNPNEMRNWLPLIPSNIRTPATRMFQIPVGFDRVLYEGIDNLKRSIAGLQNGVNAIGSFDKLLGLKEVITFLYHIREHVSMVRGKLFIKSGTGACKHGWDKTCVIDKGDDWSNLLFEVADRVFNQIEGHLLSGRRGCTIDICIREFIDTECIFKAFHGSMPITPEARFFVRSGSVVFKHPYWPPLALAGETSDPEWESKLELMNASVIESFGFLTSLSETVGKALMPLGPNWSIDWLTDADGNWWLIDVAIEEESYKWSDFKL